MGRVTAQALMDRHNTHTRAHTHSIDLPAASGGSHRPLRHIFPASSSSPLFLCTTAADVTLLLDVEQWPVFTVRWRREEALSGVEAVGFLDYVSVPSSVGEEGAAVLVPEKEVGSRRVKKCALCVCTCGVFFCGGGRGVLLIGQLWLCAFLLRLERRRLVERCRRRRWALYFVKMCVCVLLGRESRRQRRASPDLPLTLPNTNAHIQIHLKGALRPRQSRRPPLPQIPTYGRDADSQRRQGDLDSGFGGR